MDEINACEEVLPPEPVRGAMLGLTRFEKHGHRYGTA